MTVDGGSSKHVRKCRHAERPTYTETHNYHNSLRTGREPMFFTRCAGRQVKPVKVQWHYVSPGVPEDTYTVPLCFIRRAGRQVEEESMCLTKDRCSMHVSHQLSRRADKPMSLTRRGVGGQVQGLYVSPGLVEDMYRAYVSQVLLRKGTGPMCLIRCSGGQV